MTEEKKVVQIVEGKAVKPPAYKRFFGRLFQEDKSSLEEYFISDILIPNLKRGFEDFIHVMLYGIGGRGDRYSSSTRSTVSYRSYYDDNRNRNGSRVISTGYNYDDILLASRMEAEKVMQSMDDIIEQYGIISVADYYELVGVDSKYTDNNYGWSDIRNARIVRVSDGYMIKLPKALPIN